MVQFTLRVMWIKVRFILWVIWVMLSKQHHRFWKKGQYWVTVQLKLKVMWVRVPYILWVIYVMFS